MIFVPVLLLLLFFFIIDLNDYQKFVAMKLFKELKNKCFVDFTATFTSVYMAVLSISHSIL